eukprot:GHVP01061014.1.p1 GENE.GHVP01061014.1~~GHVP01061014.1.p1  ORF type:complete len:142 (+),score=18.16 GHVP01061014.1:3-428(+)
MNTSNFPLWPELKQKLGSMYELDAAWPFHIPDISKKGLDDGLLSGPEFPHSDRYAFCLPENSDNPQGWPEKIDVFLDSKEAIFEFKFFSDRVSTGRFGYEGISGVTDVIRVCFKKRQIWEEKQRQERLSRDHRRLERSLVE